MPCFYLLGPESGWAGFGKHSPAHGAGMPQKPSPATSVWERMRQVSSHPLFTPNQNSSNRSSPGYGLVCPSYSITWPTICAAPHKCKVTCDENSRGHHSRGSSKPFTDCRQWLTTVCITEVGTALSFTSKLTTFNISFSIFAIRYGV